MHLPPRARLIVLGIFASVAAFFVFGGLGALRGGGDGSGDPYDAAPHDSFLIASVNLAELRRSPLYEVLLGKDSRTQLPKAEVPIPMLTGAKGLGMDKLAEACGFDPLMRVETMTLAIPEEGDKGELGLAARVNVTRDELSRCTTQLASQRGGKVETKDVGSFIVAEDSSSEGAARPRLAYGHGSLLVVGRGAWFDAMLASADKKKPSAREAQGHAAMKASLTSKDGWRQPTVLVTALLPRSLRERLRGEMGAEIDGSGMDPKMRNAAGANNIMAGVLSVSSIGLALRAGGPGGTIDAAIELQCDNADACAPVEKLILKKRLDWSKELMLRMVGFGPLLDSIDVKRDGARIRVTAAASADALASTLDRVLRLKARQPQPQRNDDESDQPPAGGGGGGLQPANPRFPRNSPEKPDETIPARDAGKPAIPSTAPATSGSASKG